jgi:hypothetical protein
MKTRERIKELRTLGFSPLVETVSFKPHYGLDGLDYSEIQYDDGVELITPINYSRDVKLRGGLYEMVKQAYCKSDGKTVPIMLKYLQPRIRPEEMSELLRPFDSNSGFIEIPVGKAKIDKIFFDGILTYRLMLNLHRIIKKPIFGRNATAYDLLLPNSKYYD